MKTTEKKVSHTPGPWVAVAEVSKVGYTIEQVHGVKKVAIIPTTKYGLDNFGTTASANAKLIAAAPEMLRVIQEAEAWLSFNLRPDADQIRVFRNELQNVIKKATE